MTALILATLIGLAPAEAHTARHHAKPAHHHRHRPPAAPAAQNMRWVWVPGHWVRRGHRTVWVWGSWELRRAVPNHSHRHVHSHRR